jgi:hypothetical protein
MTADHPTRSPDSPDPTHEHRYSTVYEVGWPDSLEVCGCGHILTALLPRSPDSPDPHRDYAGRTCTTGLLHDHAASDSVRTPDLDVDTVANAFRAMAKVSAGFNARLDSGDFGSTPLIRPSELASEFLAALHPASPPQEGTDAD